MCIPKVPDLHPWWEELHFLLLSVVCYGIVLIYFKLTWRVLFAKLSILFVVMNTCRTAQKSIGYLIRAWYLGLPTCAITSFPTTTLSWITKATEKYKFELHVFLRSAHFQNVVHFGESAPCYFHRLLRYNSISEVTLMIIQITEQPPLTILKLYVLGFLCSLL